MEIQGKLIVKGDTVQVSDKFKKREFVVQCQKEVSGDVYLNPIPCQLTQDNCSKIDNINIGDEVKVQIDIRGNKWEREGQEDRYFVNINAWKIERVSEARPNNQVDSKNNDNPDDLPF